LLKKARWVLLAFVPSSLMLGVTTYMSTDIAPIPLIWVIPLALYLLSFIFVFARMPEWVHQLMVLSLPVVVLLQVFMTLAEMNDPLWMAIAVHLVTLFLAAMVCHGELARDRPTTKHLTEFYLLMSLGGVLGGMFNALAAPMLFNTIIEYPLILVVVCMIMPQLEEVKEGRYSKIFDYALPVTLGVGTFLAIWALSSAEGGRFIRDVKEFLDEAFGKATPGRDKLAKLMMYGVPALICYAFVTRSMRFGLGVGALLLAGGLYDLYEPGAIKESEVLLRHRSFFGVLKLEDYKYQYRYGLTENQVGELRSQNVPDETLDKIEDLVGRAQPESQFFANLRSHWTAEEYEKYSPLVREVATKYRWANSRRLVHGTTLHGTMCIDNPDPYKLAPAFAPLMATSDFEANLLDYLAEPMWSDPRPRPQTYYARMGPVGQLFQEFSGPKAKPSVALIGLGTGTLSAYGQKGQKVTFYEIDAAVVDIARNHFNYLKTCQADELNIELGDARISMKDVAKDGEYGIIVVDAFSSDAIPWHLITKEALQLYLQKAAPDGIIAFHISNRYLNLQPVLANLAEVMDPPLVGIVRHGRDDDRFDPPVPNYGMSASTWVLLSRNRANFGSLTKDSDWEDLADSRDPKVGVWTDDFSNILSVFNWGH
ncbi:MAG: spermidine synthase, partial [Gemmataceae bacterium]